LMVLANPLDTRKRPFAEESHEIRKIDPQLPLLRRVQTAPRRDVSALTCPVGYW
jgi:hypothetical protein